MKFRSGLLSAAVALSVVVPAFARQPQLIPGGGGATTGQTPDPGPAAQPAPQNGASPAGASAAAPGPKKESTPMAGYAYSDKPVAASRAPVRARARGPSGPSVNMPGYEPLADGGSRFFVQLSQTVPVEERRAAGSITYVLKGASPRVWNNTNALVTVHFNTPVSRARLVPHGKDLLFVVDLRAAATPVWKVSDAPDKGAILAIDFPKGDYLDPNGQPVPSAAPVPAASGMAGAPDPKPTRVGRRGGRGGPPPSNAAGPKP